MKGGIKRLEAINILPGRIRFKSSAIYINKCLAKYINTYSEGLFGVMQCEVNIYTCSILIKYDCKKTDFNTIKDNLSSVINATSKNKKELLNNYSIYYKTLEKKNVSRNKFLAFSLLYIFFKTKQISFGKFSLSRNILVFELASLVTIIGGYPLFRKIFKQSTRSISSESEIILNMVAVSFTISRESSKGVLVLVLKHMNNYIKLASDVACMRTLNCNMSRTSGMAWLIRNNQQEILLNVKNLKIEDIIVIHKGELIPVDGEIIEGKASISSLYLTGQPIINDVNIGNKVYEGIILMEGELKVKVTKVPEEYNKTNLSLNDLNVTSKLNVYEKIITPVSILMATVNFLFTGNILNALGVLLVCTPSASRTALNSGIKNYVTALSKQNIYLRNPECIESISNATQVVFDKTGTLTQGNMDIVRVDSLDNNYSRDEILSICSECEVDSYHAVALSFKAAVHSTNMNSTNKVKDIIKIPSKGVEAYYNHQKVLIGGLDFINENGVDISNASYILEEYKQMHYKTIILCINGNVTGLFAMQDIIRPSSIELVKKLRYIGVKDIYLLTGDDFVVAADVSKKLSIDEGNVFSNYNYSQKETFIKEHKNNGNIIMVGDGINDERAMRASDVSVSFSNNACDKLKLQSDCIIFEDDMIKLTDLILISNKSIKQINNSITMSQVYNLLFGTLAFFQYFDAFTAKSLNTMNSLMVLLINERIRWTKANNFGGENTYNKQKEVT